MEHPTHRPEPPTGCGKVRGDPSVAKQRERTVQGAKRGETGGGGHRAGGREGQQSGSGLKDSPLKAMQTCKTGPVALVLEDANVFSKKKKKKRGSFYVR